MAIISGSDNRSVQKVFGNILLRHKMVNYVIWNKNRSHSSGDGHDKPEHYLNKPIVLNLRLVSKSWLWSVNTLLRTERYPLFKIDLTTVQPSKFPDHCLKRCIDVLSKSSIYVDAQHGFCQLPTLSLSIYSTLFLNEHKDLMKQFLEILGNGLTELNLFIVYDNVSANHKLALAGPFDTQSFPVLDEISIQTCFLGGEIRQSFTSSELQLLQDILQFVEPFALRKLHFHGSLPCYYTNEFIKNVITPTFKRQKNLTHFHMESSVHNGPILERFLAYGFSNLTSLRFYATSTPLQGDLIFRILSGIGSTLKDLRLDGDRDTGFVIPFGERTYLTFPQKLEKLKRLKIKSNEWYPIRFDSNRFGSWKTPPTFKSLSFSGVNEQVFDQWTEDFKNGQKYGSVEKMKIRLLVADWEKRTLHLTQDKMLKVSQVFPNVVHLKVCMVGTEACGVKYIFREMRRLQSLEIHLMVGYPNVEDMNLGNDEDNGYYYGGSEYWDGLLIGASSRKVLTDLEKTEGIFGWRRPDQGKREAMMAQLLSQEESIRNLVNLKSFCLKSGIFVIGRHGLRPSLISSLSFEWGFDKMEGLKELQLFGNFRVCSQIEKLLEKFHRKNGCSKGRRSRFQKNNGIEEVGVGLVDDPTVFLIEVVFFIALIVVGWILAQIKYASY